MSETLKYRSLTEGYCRGNGLDIGSGGSPVVPWAIQVDLPSEEYGHYHADQRPESFIHWRGDCTRLPFRPNVFDFVYSSHVLEDFENWREVVSYWSTFVKRGGHLVIMVPDKVRFNEAIKEGQPPNLAHRHEFTPGELSQHFSSGHWSIISDKLTELHPGDYNILFVARRVS